MDYNEARKKFKAAHGLLAESSTTSEKVRAAVALLKGVHPRIDQALAGCDEHLLTLEKLQSGSVIELSAERLPEGTEEEKKRKKALLLFIRSWDSLKSEVARVEKEFEDAKSGQSAGGASMWQKIFSATKGPLAVITLVAIGLAALQATSVTMTIQNDGCGTLQVQSRVPITLPGLSLPNQPIESGDSATATIPPLSVAVDGTVPGLIKMSALGLNLSFELPGVADVRLDGASLIGVKTDIKLSEKDTHELRLICGN